MLPYNIFKICDCCPNGMMFIYLQPALYTYILICVDRPLLVVHQHGNTAQVHVTPASAIAVDRRVRHLETQLRRQRQQRDSQQRQTLEYGGTRRIAARVGNDYVDFRSWFRMMRNNGSVGMTTLAISDRGIVETAPLNGMHSTTTANRIGEIV